MRKITVAFCLVLVCVLAGATQTLAACPNGYSAYGHSCVPNAGTPSSPSDETLNTGRYKSAKKLGVHPSGSQSSRPSREQVCPKGYKGTPPNCATVQDGKKITFF